MKNITITTKAIKTYFCEAVGTFFLVLAGTGAIIANAQLGGQITHVGIALTFGLVVMAVIYAIGDTSGAHLNPTVSIGFYTAKRLSLKDTLFYILFQCLGAVTASIFLKTAFPLDPLLGTTLPSVSIGGAFMYEFLITWLLMLVILSVATGAKEKGLMAGLAIGGTVTLAALFAGPVTGASMNPARSLAPAMVSGHLESLWIYILAPILGAITAVPSCRFLHMGNCCE